MVSALFLFRLIMDYERIFLYTVGAIVGLFTLYKTTYLPWKLERDKAKQDHEIKASDDTREYYQTREANAFSQTLSINERLVQVLIDISDQKYNALNSRFDEVEKILYAINQHIAREATNIEFSNRERVQMQEQLSDIDISLHTITELLRAALRNGTLKDE